MSPIPPSTGYRRGSPDAANTPVDDPWYDRYRVRILRLPVTRRAVRMAASLASAPASVKNALVMPGGVTRASISPTSARISVTMNGDTNATLAICSATAAAPGGRRGRCSTHMAMELKSM